jgi:hypothetical protein
VCNQHTRSLRAAAFAQRRRPWVWPLPLPLLKALPLSSLLYSLEQQQQPTLIFESIEFMKWL